jgi:hypothetical protein
MTERAFPLTGLAPVSTSVPRAVPAAVARTRATPARTPVHVAVAVGVTAGLYAVSLAGVASLQAETNGRLAADRAPAAAAVEALRTSHDQTEAALARIAAGYADAATTYEQLAAGITRHETALGRLGKRVAAVEGSAAALRVPSVRLPSVSSGTVYVASSRPATNVSTGASGGK